MQKFVSHLPFLVDDILAVAETRIFIRRRGRSGAVSEETESGLRRTFVLLQVADVLAYFVDSDLGDLCADRHGLVVFNRVSHPERQGINQISARFESFDLRIARVVEEI